MLADTHTPPIGSIDLYPYDEARDYRFFTSSLSPALTNVLLIKRSLTPEEYKWDRPAEWYESRRMMQSLRNEVAAIDFVKAHTSIPVPSVIAAFYDRGAYYVMMQKEQNIIPLSHVPIDQRAKAMIEMDSYVAQLQQLRSRRFGGVQGDTVLPAGIVMGQGEVFCDLEFPEMSLNGEEYAFCHGDLHTANILVDAVTLSVKCVIDWECAGFYPAEFEGRWYTRDGSPYARIPEIEYSQEWGETVLRLATKSSLFNTQAKLNASHTKMAVNTGEDGRMNLVPNSPHVPLLGGGFALRYRPFKQLDEYLIHSYQILSRLIHRTPPPPPIIDKEMEYLNISDSADIGPKDPDFLRLEGESAGKRWEVSHKDLLQSLCGVTISACRNIRGFLPLLTMYLQREFFDNKPVTDPPKTATPTSDAESPHTP